MTNYTTLTDEQLSALVGAGRGAMMREPITILTCERCGSEERSDQKPYWSQCHAACSWKVPPDGINLGKFEGVLCHACRIAESHDSQMER